MTPILKVTLPHSGIVRTFTHDVLYAPDEFSGMGLMHPYYHQFSKHLDLALKESIRPTITSNLLVATLEQPQLESGLPCTDGDWKLPEIQACLTSS